MDKNNVACQSGDSTASQVVMVCSENSDYFATKNYQQLSKTLYWYLSIQLKFVILKYGLTIQVPAPIY